MGILKSIKKRIKSYIFDTKISNAFPLEAIEIEQEFTISKNNDNVAIFAVFDQNCEFKESVIYYLKELKKVCGNIILVANNPIKKEEIKKISNLVAYCICKYHKKYDFGSYQLGFEVVQKISTFKNSEQLILCNDSCFGPIFPFGDILIQMKNKNVDFWGLTDNVEIRYHLQSYFLVFTNKVFNSFCFVNFIKNIKKLSYQDIILCYEIPLTNFLRKCGFSSGVFIKSNGVLIGNPTRFPIYLLNKGFPFIKKKAYTMKNFILERDRGGGIALFHEIEKYNYKLAQIIKKEVKIDENE